MHYAALCWSDRVLVYPIQITDAFIRNAGSLHRCHVMLCHVPKDLRKACDKIVPGIGGMIEDDLLYAKVMAKILTPEEMTDWEFSMVDESISISINICTKIMDCYTSQ